MEKENQFYRPAWTCGRYNEGHRVALMYNLVEGYSYFFEAHSADVVRHVLASPRGAVLDAARVASATGIDLGSVRDFFALLEGKGLLVRELPTPQGIADYRHAVGRDNVRQQSVPKPTVEKLPMQVSTAESEYFRAVEEDGGVASVMLELTYNCSERCVHCYNVGATRNDSEVSHRSDVKSMTVGEYKRVIDDLVGHGLVRVCLSGGDPFSNPDAWEIVDYLYQKELATDIFTNGQRLVGQTDRLAAYYPHIVGISIYSDLAADHDAITRVEGSWQRSMDVARELSRLGVPMQIKCCVMQPNLHSFYRVADLARGLGAVPQFEVSISDSIEGDTCARSLRLTEEQLRVVLRLDDIPLYVGPEAPNHGGQPRSMDHPTCGAGHSSFCITPSGDVQPCCAFPMVVGNVRHAGWPNVGASEKLERWRRAVLRDYEECGRHDYCDYCNLCVGQAYVEHGDYRKPSENSCYMARIRHRLAHDMMQGIDPLQGNDFVSVLQRLPKATAVLRRTYGNTKG